MLRPGNAKLAFIHVATLLSLGLAYYLGSLVGLELRLPPSTPSVMWPPNGILTAALLLTPPRRWAFYLLAALPAHLAAQFPTDWPRSLIVALFLTNCSEALLAASSVRLLNDAPDRLDTVRRLLVFQVCVVVLAPTVSSFGDAAVVTWLRGEPYWLVLSRRLSANMLAALTVVPAILSLVAAWRATRHPIAFGRYVEAGALAIGIAAAGLLALQTPLHSEVLHTVFAEAPLALHLPLVIWATVRFGPPGAALTLLPTTLVAADAAVHGHLLFPMLQHGAAMLALQAILMVVALTVLSLGTLTEERRRTQDALAERLRFEELLSRLSGAFVQIPSDRLADTFELWLGRIGAFGGFDCVRLFAIAEDGAELKVAAAWCRPGFGPFPPPNARRDFPWAHDQLVEHHHVAVSDVDALPTDATVDRTSLRTIGLNAFLAVPLVAGHHVLGALTFGRAIARPFASDLVGNLRLVSEVFANALGRRHAELEAERSHKALAHVTRVSTISVLTMSLAHQLSQPLNGIMNNAEAATRLLEGATPDLQEVQAILADIRDDDRRASEVIQRLRELLRRGELRMDRVDVVMAIRDVSTLLRSDALMRHVTIVLELDDGPIIVQGDRVQLQQVVLNLLVNALDATGDLPECRRTVRVGCRRTRERSVEVTVRDSGIGVPAACGEAVFEPFYTTKPEGMGMGLSIAQSIVKLHGGNIRLQSSGQETIAAFFLPLAPAAQDILDADTPV